MRIDSVGVTTTDMDKAVQFYSVLGFDFSNADLSGPHVEPAHIDGSARLMIDKVEIIREIIGEEPKPSNHSVFAIRYDSPKEVNEVAEKLTEKGFEIVKQPWDAFWGQRYAVVQDPDGYRVDLYSPLK